MKGVDVIVPYNNMLFAFLSSLTEGFNIQEIDNQRVKIQDIFIFAYGGFHNV